MKKRKIMQYIGTSALLGAFTLGIFALPVSQTETAEAATLSGVVFEDKFADNTLSNAWIKNDFAIYENSYYSMRFDNQTDYGSAMLYTDYQIHTDCKISFDFYQSNVDAAKKSGNWFGLLFGYDDDSAHFTGGNAAILSYGRGQTQLMDDGDGTSEKLVADSYDQHAKYANSYNATEGILYTVELVVSYTGTRYSDGVNLYQVDGYYYEKAGERSLVPKFSYKGIAADGYFGFSSMSSSVIDVSNLQIFEGDERVGCENFQEENGEGKKLISNSETSVWRSVNCSELKLYSYFNGRIDTSDCAEGLLLSNYSLTPDTLNKQTFDISYTAEIVALPENSGFGVALGLGENVTMLSESTFIGLEGLADNQFRFIHKQNGDVIAQTGAIPQALFAEGQNDVHFVGYYDGKVEVKIGGYTACFENATASGLVGIATTGTQECSVYIDDFCIVRSDYVSTVADNYAMNFEGIKETHEQDYVLYERYIDESLWYLGSGVEFQKIYREGANFIQVTDSNERTFFGAKQQYSEFICRFSITVTKNRGYSQGAYIGLSFGKDNRNDRAVDSHSLMFGMTDSGMILQGYNGTLVGADSKGVIKQYETYPELDFWSQEEWQKGMETYRVMMVVRGGNAYLYYANEKDMSEMNVCKAVMTGMETSGYVTLSALGGATFRINDFSVTNIALNAKAETLGVGANEVDSEYVKVDFAKDALYTATGATQQLGRGISLGYHSSVKINEKYTDFLAYVDINSVAGEGIALGVGDKVIKLNADGSIYSEMQQIGGSSQFDFTALKNGGVVMIQAIGSTLSVGVVGNHQPTDLLENLIAVYQIENREQPIDITISTESQTVLSLQSVRLYTLKPTIKIEADHWEEGDNQFPIKNSPAGEITNTPVENNGGCASSLSGVGALPIVLALGFALVCKKRGTNDEQV